MEKAFYYLKLDDFILIIFLLQLNLKNLNIDSTFL